LVDEAPGTVNTENWADVNKKVFCVNGKKIQVISALVSLLTFYNVHIILSGVPSSWYPTDDALCTDCHHSIYDLPCDNFQLLCRILLR